MQIGVGELQRETAVPTMAAGRAGSILAQEKLRDPECEALFADATRAGEQQRRGQ